MGICNTIERVSNGNTKVQACGNSKCYVNQGSKCMVSSNISTYPGPSAQAIGGHYWTGLGTVLEASLPSQPPVVA